MSEDVILSQVAAALDRMRGEAVKAVARDICTRQATHDLLPLVMDEIRRLLREDPEIRDTLRARVLSILAGPR